MDIDDLKCLDETTRKEVGKLLQVTRAESGNDDYALAQLRAGTLLYENNRIDDALVAWGNIKETDSREIFISAQWNVSTVLMENNNLEGALSIWRSIKRTDDSKMYAQAQWNIGLSFDKSSNIGEAILAWRNIKRSDDKDIYAKAKYNIGNALGKNDDFKGALLAWESIERTDSLEVYAKAQYKIGCLLLEGNKIQEALSAWRNVESSVAPEEYAQAQFNIGSVLLEDNKVQEALLAWESIERENSREVYANAQYNIGIALEKNGNIKKALSAWRNIKREDDLEIYAKAQSHIGILLIDNDISAAEEAFKSASEYHLYSSYCYLKIIELLTEEDSNEIGKKLQLLFNEVTLILKELTLDFVITTLGEKSPERKLAHYTSTDTANKMLSLDEKTELPSSFRLNTINNVNDPSEGQLLISYLNNDKKELSHTPEFNDEFQAFISCFTFNHDSLNQFRLYGKQNNKEASGVSLVFNKDFFQSSSSLGNSDLFSAQRKSEDSSKDFFQSSNPLDNLSVSSVQKKSKDFNKDLKQKYNESSSILVEDKKPNKKISKQSIMRCVYLEPATGYIELAQRNRLTFYREFEDNPKVLWDKYKSGIDIKTGKVNSSLEVLRDTYQGIRDSHTENFEKHSYLIDKIFLPLKYLIKHSAFQEEQECRMVHITSLDNPEVIMDYGKFLYVEYAAGVKENLDKVYIAPVATQYRPYLAKLLGKSEGKKKVRIELSNNPYRQT